MGTLLDVLDSELDVRAEPRDDGGFCGGIRIVNDLQVGCQMKPRGDGCVIIDFTTLRILQSYDRTDEPGEVAAEPSIEVSNAHRVQWPTRNYPAPLQRNVATPTVKVGITVRDHPLTHQTEMAIRVATVRPYHLIKNVSDRPRTRILPGDDSLAGHNRPAGGVQGGKRSAAPISQNRM